VSTAVLAAAQQAAMVTLAQKLACWAQSDLDGTPRTPSSTETDGAGADVRPVLLASF
jgi:hypothetical protein